MTTPEETAMLEYLIRILADGRQIAGQSEQAVRSLGRIEKAAKEAQTAVDGAMAGRAAGGAVGGAAAAGGIAGWLKGAGRGALVGTLGALGLNSAGGFVTGAINRAGALSDLADQTQLSTDQLQKWQYAAEQAGLSLQDLIQGFEYFRMAQAQALEKNDGSEAKILKSLGVDPELARSMNQGNLYEMVLDRLSARGSGPEALDQMRTMFGRGGERLARAGRAGVRTMGEQFDASGFGISSNELKTLDEFGDWMNRQKFRLAHMNASLLVGWNKSGDVDPVSNMKRYLEQPSLGMSQGTGSAQILSVLQAILAESKQTTNAVKNAL